MANIDGYLTFEDGLVNLGEKQVPGILKSCSIGCDVRFDEAEKDSQSGKAKMPLGWEDADISLGVDLLSDAESTCYDKLEELNALFKGHDNGANPKVYSVVNVHLKARGIRQVVFRSLNSRENASNDVVSCSLQFVEHKPVVVKVEERKSGKAPAVNTEQVKPARTIAVDDYGGV